MKELTYTLEERPLTNNELRDRDGRVVDSNAKPAIIMKDSEGFIVGVFSDKLEAEQAWPKIRYNLEKTNKRVNLKYATLRYVRPTMHVLFSNKRSQQNQQKRARK